jgi:vang-like
VIWNDVDYRPTQTWSIACDRVLSCCAGEGTVLELRQGDVTLLVSVRRLPHFNLVEEVLDPKANKFVLRMNSETSV